MSATPEQLALRRIQAELVLNLSRVARAVERRLAVLLSDEGLERVTAAQANALLVLFQHREPMTARRLAAHMGLSEVTVGRFVRALEQAGWLVRAPDPHDARAILLAPSRRARRALPRFLRVSNRLLDLTFAALEREEIERLASLAARVSASLEP